ncbi:AfsR/SARP family transcriptional regulator [Sphaerisporangium krabiense]|nr:BTAD domain-containing putative transcriptional regulator [Sphaerisporangium krabiense]
MDFRILGPLEIFVHGRPVEVKAAKQRTLLALFLMRPNQVLSADVLADELWGARPPRTARDTLYSLVSRLRGQIDGAGARAAEWALTSHPPGYLLRVDPAAVDAHRFLALTTAAHRLTATPPAGVAGRLDEALRLWRGVPLADIALGPMLESWRKRLIDDRLAAFEKYVEALLPTGVPPETLDELRMTASEHPYREGLWELLMRALRAAGRRDEALAAYREARAALSGELGIEPGPGLRRLHQEVLSGEPEHGDDGPRTGEPPAGDGTAPVREQVPRQLPRDLTAFTGRRDEVATLRGHLTMAAAEAAPVLIVTGPAGSGKSALAVHVAHQVADAYPDGQLYIDLCGATPGLSPLSPSTALGRILRALGVPGEHVPLDAGEAAGLYRTRTATARLLLILDNARDAAQVRPLLPGGARSAVMVTSRMNLAHLPDAVCVPVGPMRPQDACQMLSRAGAAPSETADVTRLAELCGFLPLALAVAVARLTGQRHLGVGELVRRMEDGRRRLSELAVGDLEVRRSLEVSYVTMTRDGHAMDREAARALLLLALLPIPDIGVDAAAALFGQTPAEAARTLQRLVDANLLNDTARDRWSMHDLVRLFAREKSAGDLASGHWPDRFGAILDHYLATARLAFRLIDPHREQFPVSEPTAPAAPLADAADARTWFRTELPGAVRLAVQALSEPDRPGHAGMALAGALRWILDREDHVEESLTMYELALQAARRLGDPQAEIYALDQLGGMLYRLGRYDEACRNYLQEQELCRRHGDLRGQTRALGNLGLLYVRMRRPAEALAVARRQLRFADEGGWDAARTHAHIMLGMSYLNLGGHDDAATHLCTAVDQARARDDHYQLAAALNYLSQVRIAMGQGERARDLARQGLGYARLIADRKQEASLLITLARAHSMTGDRQAAESALTTAGRLEDALDSPLVDYLAGARAEVAAAR